MNGRCVRSIPLIWPAPGGGWVTRVLLDAGEGAADRWRWQDGTKVRPEEWDRVARELVRLSGGEGEANHGT